MLLFDEIAVWLSDQLIELKLLNSGESMESKCRACLFTFLFVSYTL